MNKAQLRKYIKAEYQKRSEKEIEQQSQALCWQIDAFFKNTFVQSVGRFQPLKKSEPNIEKALDGFDIECSFPECLNSNKMVFKSALTKEEVTPGALLIPGLAFTFTGERLGRGKGFFDKYLINYTGLKLGVCLDFQLLKTIPLEAHDQKVDGVITPKGVFETSLALRNWAVQGNMKSEKKII